MTWHFSSQGDGDSAPDTPPNEESTSNDDDVDTDDAKKVTETNDGVKSNVVTSANVETSNPFSVEVRVDLMAFGLFLISFASRMVWLDQPKNVV